MLTLLRFLPLTDPSVMNELAAQAQDKVDGVNLSSGLVLTIVCVAVILFAVYKVAMLLLKIVIVVIAVGFLIYGFNLFGPEIRQLIENI